MSSPRRPYQDLRDPSILRATPEELEAVQGARLAETVDYVATASTFWQRKLAAVGVGPGDVTKVEDVRSLPMCDRTELQRDQREHPPFGSYTASEPRTWSRMFTTSGTTREPLRRVYSIDDWDRVLARFTRTRAWTADDILLVLGPVDGLLGPSATYAAAIDAGAMAVAAGLWSTERKIEAILELRPTTITGTASYLIRLIEVAEDLGVDLAGVGVERITSAGEPGASVPSTREFIRERFGGALLFEGYGLTELFPLGGSCRWSSAIHLHEDLVLVECLEPGTDTPVPPGQVGELVYTNLVGDTQPLLRYRSGDLGRLSPRAPCRCGHTHRRIERSIEGRSDDMLWHRGVNLFPSSIEQVVRSLPGLGSEYQVRVSRDEGGRQQIQVVVERTSASDAPRLRDRLASELKQVTGVTLDVGIVELGSLPRTDGATKTTRVVRLDATEVLG